MTDKSKRILFVTRRDWERISSARITLIRMWFFVYFLLTLDFTLLFACTEYMASLVSKHESQFDCAIFLISLLICVLLPVLVFKARRLDELYTEVSADTETIDN